MARKRSKADETAENAWLEILEAAGEGSGSVGVWRKLANGERDYLGTATVEEMRHDTLEVIRERWGGGKFVVQLKDDAGKFMAGTRSHFQIAGPPKDPNAVPDTDPKLEALEKRLEELVRKDTGPESMMMLELLRQMAELRKPAEPQRRDTVADILKALSPLLAPILAKLMESKDPGPSSMDRLEELTQLMELAKGMQGPQDGIAALAKPLAEPIGKLLSAHAEGAPATGAQPNPPQEAQVSDGRPPWYNFLAPIVPQALRWAATGKDVAFRADFIVDELSDEQLGPVHATLTSPGFREAFYQHFPEAVPHVAWFDALFQRIVYNIMDEDEIAAMEAGDGDELEQEAAELEEARAPELEVEAEPIVEELPPDPPAEVGGPGTVAGVEIL